MSFKPPLIRLVGFAALLSCALLAGGASAQTPQFDAWFEAEDVVAVEREVARLHQANADDPVALIATARLGLSHHDDSRMAAGIEAMERCLRRNDADARCHLWLGRCYGRKALDAGMVAGVRYAGRIRMHFERAVALDPESIEARFDLNQFYILAPSIAGGGKAKARENNAAFATLRPALATLLHAQLDIAEERLAEADRRLLGFAGSDDRGVSAVWQGQFESLGFLYFSRKPPRLDDARRVFAAAAERFPRNELFRRGLGRVAQEQGRFDEAARHFEQALAIKAQPGAHYRLAQVAEKLGDTARAITHYEKTLRFPRDMPAAVLRDSSERLRVLQKL